MAVEVCSSLLTWLSGSTERVKSSIFRSSISSLKVATSFLESGKESVLSRRSISGVGVGVGMGMGVSASVVIYLYVPSCKRPANVFTPGKYLKKLALNSSSKVKELSLNSESITLT